MGDGEAGHRLGTKPVFIGFGEAAQAFVSGWAQSGISGFSAYDIKTGSTGTERDAKLADYRRHRIEGCERVEDAVGGAELIFSMVTADQAFEAACETSNHIAASAIYLDCNSCAPGTKRQAADVIEGKGAAYVDVAVMAPVHPLLQKTPVLVSGKKAAAVLPVLQGAGMDAAFAGSSVGQASAIKLCRSIMVKGMEALMAECMLSARSLGVDDDVLASLEASDPGYDWRERAGYALERMKVHGARRAAEMREAASMVADLSITPHMSESTARWQQQIADLKALDTDSERSQMLDQILNQISDVRQSSKIEN